MVFNVSARLISTEPSLVHLSKTETWKEKKSRREIPVLQPVVLKNQPQNIMGATFKCWLSYILEPQYHSRQKQSVCVRVTPSTVITVGKNMLSSKIFAYSTVSVPFFVSFSSVRCSSSFLTLTSRRPSTNGGSLVPHCQQSTPTH